MPIARVPLIFSRDSVNVSISQVDISGQVTTYIHQWI